MKSLIAACCCVVGLAACGDDDATLSLNLTGLEALGAGYVYEGWVIVDGSPVSTGRFNLDANGDVPGTFTLDSDMAEIATNFVLSIEPETGDDPAPAATKVLAGAITDNAATLSVADAMALGTSFSTAAGRFIVATPSSADANDDAQGIWWFDPSVPETGLTLPTLPAGWAYEGWVVASTGPVSTGRFTDPAMADSDGVGATGGTDGCTVGNMCPATPGQDFINPAQSLLGYAAVISVEPEPDDSAAPFALKPLFDSDITDLAPPTTQDMVNQSASNNPTGTATITLE